LEASDVIYKELKDRLVYSQYKFYFKEKNIWVQDSKNIFGCLVKHIMMSRIYKSNDQGDTIDFVQNRGSAENVAKTVLDTAIQYKTDDWYDSIFASSLGKILFTNGYYDFKEALFYANDDEEFDKSIIFVEQINYDWERPTTEEEFDYIGKLRQKLFYTPFGKDVGDYFTINLARGLAGDCMKICLFGIGSSNTGKSIITSALKSTCGG
jgi:hypothetical protein